MVFVKGRMCFDKGDGENKPAVFPSIVLVFHRGEKEVIRGFSRVDINGEEIE